MQQSETKHLPRAGAKQFEKAVVQIAAGRKKGRDAVGRTGMPFVKTGQVTVETRSAKKIGKNIN